MKRVASAMLSSIMQRLRRWKIWRTTPALLVLAIGFSMYFLGAVTVVDRGPVYQFGKTVFAKITGVSRWHPSEPMVPPPAPDQQTQALSGLIDTTHLELTVASRAIEVARPGLGGGMAPFADGALLMTHGGKFHFVSKNAKTHPLDITAPDLQLDEYRADAEKYFPDLNHYFERFRYMNIEVAGSEDSPEIFISYSLWITEERCYVSVVSAVKIDTLPEDLMQLRIMVGDWREVYRTAPCLALHERGPAVTSGGGGGALLHDGAKTLYAAIGDYHFDGIQDDLPLAQDPAYPYGKMIAIDLESGEARQFTSGHRNAQSMTFGLGGEIYAVEHGLRAGDELNRIREGFDYGYPSESFSTLYGTHDPISDRGTLGRHDRSTPPIFAWLPAIAPATVTTVDGFHPAWDGDLLVGSLKQQLILRLRLDGDRVVFSEPIPLGQRVRALTVSDGVIFGYTDNRQVFVMKPVEADAVPGLLEASLVALEVSDAQRARIEDAFRGCVECHGVSGGDASGLPALAGMYGRPIAGTSYAAYSDGLRFKGGDWDRAALRAMLRDPQAFAPGTAMPNPGIRDDTVLEGIIDVLEALSAGPN